MDFYKFRESLGETNEGMDELSGAVIGAAIEVHKELGPGLTESLYENALCEEFDFRGIPCRRQVVMPVFYKGKAVGDLRLDLLVGERLIVELKACEALQPVHKAQL